ncbi:hypothetical protein L6164_036838 [Bauhinia variegata]|uniref:Uncharacterized protein n=1 Tax=Bauhinia variegata TaxID=167791 RepID=A0ACB9KIF8_BAUVA|nr:hypothetical protein L6164_036838 [Bauhinia variegata]
MFSQLIGFRKLDIHAADLIVNVSLSGPIICNKSCSYPHPEIWTEEVKGIELRWQPNQCGVWQKQGDGCSFDKATNMVVCWGEFFAFLMEVSWATRMSKISCFLSLHVDMFHVNVSNRGTF